ncbi:MAG: DUF4430 domain-containing protein [Thermoleophilia bacterium]|nr:DUF4430 domain-containing protein [Thermoleophilia bacterium]
MRRLVLLLLALVLAGCGAGARGHGTATLWVTRDRGAQVLFAGTVPSGDNGIRTVERELKITTRYGGRYLQSVDGIAGSLTAQRDWFYFVNGVEGEVSAADVRLRPGDILWWDFRHWTPLTMHIAVVLGAYPEPFLRGLPGKTNVLGADRRLAARIAAEVHGVVNGKAPPRNFVVIGGRLPADTARIRRFRRGALLELGARAARRLAADPAALRYRFGNVQ